MYVPETPGVAVIVADEPEQIVGLFTVTVGSGLTIIANVVVFDVHAPVGETTYNLTAPPLGGTLIINGPEPNPVPLTKVVPVGHVQLKGEGVHGTVPV